MRLLLENIGSSRLLRWWNDQPFLSARCADLSLLGSPSEMLPTLAAQVDSSHAVRSLRAHEAVPTTVALLCSRAIRWSDMRMCSTSHNTVLSEHDRDSSSNDLQKLEDSSSTYGPISSSALMQRP